MHLFVGNKGKFWVESQSTRDISTIQRNFGEKCLGPKEFINGKQGSIPRVPPRVYGLKSSLLISFYVTTDTIDRYIQILNRSPILAEKGSYHKFKQNIATGSSFSSSQRNMQKNKKVIQNLNFLYARRQLVKIIFFPSFTKKHKFYRHPRQAGEILKRSYGQAYRLHKSFTKTELFERALQTVGF